jgi:glutamyl-tRNA synthetase
MKISHVMRGDDWIPSFPKHVLLYQAFGWEIPPHGHVPMVTGADKKKLGKRHGATSVLQFRNDGYLPEALFNFLARLGWSLDDKSEIFSRQQLIEAFTLDKIERAPAIFDYGKLDWLNGYYIRELPDDEFAARALSFVPSSDPATMRALAPLVKPRIKKLNEIAGLVDFFFELDLEYDPQLLVGKGMDAAAAHAALRAAHVTLEKHAAFDDEEKIEAELRGDAEKLGMKNLAFFGALRVAVTGKTVSPPLMSSIRLLGRDKTLRRVARAMARLEEIK